MEKFVRKDTPKEVKRIGDIVNSKVPEQLIGTWETIHYKVLADGQVLYDEDIIPSSYVSTYKKLTFSSNHVVNEYSTYDTDYHTSNYFMVDGKNLLISSSLSGLVNANYDYVETERIEFVSNSEMTLTRDNGGSQTSIYTYKKIQ